MILASVGTVATWAFVISLVVGLVGLVLIRRDEQRARRSARDAGSSSSRRQ